MEKYSVIPTSVLNKMIRVLDRLDRPTWLTAKQTGKTREQLRWIRLTQPHRVKPTVEGRRSYLYNLEN